MKNLIKPRTLFAFMFYGTVCYMFLRQIEVPEFLRNVVLVLLGHYFGKNSVKKEVNGGTKSGN